MTMQLVGWAIVHSLWQGGVIALVAACLFALARDMKASTRYAIGLAGLALMIVLPILTAINSTRARNVATTSEVAPLPASSTFTVPVGTSTTPTGENVSQASPAATPAQGLDASMANGSTRTDGPTIAVRIDAFILRYFETALPWFALAWVFGLLIASAQLIGGVARTRRITRVGISSPDSALIARVRELSEKLGVSRAVRVLQSVSIDVPLVVGALRPVIVIPASLITGMTPLQLDMLIAHELAHVRRYDFLVNLVQTVVETLLFYHPAARWLSDRIREERENCCDDIAVSICGGDASGYTEALLALEESRSEGFGLAAAATGGSLLRRAHRLITGRTPHVELGPRWIAGVITIAAALFTGSEAMGRGVESSFTPLSAEVFDSEEKDSTGKHKGDPDPARAGPGQVVRSPLGGTLDERWRWANSQGRGLGTYWVGYVIAGDPTGKTNYYADEIPVRIDRSSFMRGRLMMGEDLSAMNFHGVPLAPVIGQHARGSTVVFMLFNNGVLGRRVQRVRVATFGIPMYFDRRPVIWLDSANDGESVELIGSLMPEARNEEMRRDLVAAIGMHRTAQVVVPRLTSLLQSRTESEGMRREAADWLGKTNDARAVVALSRAARFDRSKGVQDEAIEAFEHMPTPAATDSLISFASTLVDRDLRRTAIESLGHREEPRALEYLARLVRSNAEDELKIDAIEAIAEMPNGRGVETILSFARSDPDPDIRREAVESIAQFDPPSRALDVLAQIARNDSDESVRREAAETIAEVHDARSVSILRDLAINSSDTQLQIEAVESLGETVDDASALKALTDIVRNHPNADVRREAAETLGDFHDEVGALRILRSVIESDKDLDVRTKAVEALGELRGETGMPLLRQLASSSKDQEVRAKAREILEDK